MIHTYSWEYPRPLSPFTHLLSIYLIYFGIKSFKFNLNKIKCKEQGYDKLGLVSTCLEVQDSPCKLSNSCKMLQGRKNAFLARFDKHSQREYFCIQDNIFFRYCWSNPLLYKYITRPEAVGTERTQNPSLQEPNSHSKIFIQSCIFEFLFAAFFKAFQPLILIPKVRKGKTRSFSMDHTRWTPSYALIRLHILSNSYFYLYCNLIKTNHTNDFIW